MACGDKDDTGDAEAPDCDGHGEWFEDHGHCHCDDGYQLVDEGMGCAPSESGEDEDDHDHDHDHDDGDDGDDATAFSPDSVEGQVYTGDQTAWLLVAKEGETWLSIENYPSYGGASGPETRTLDATDVNYATCGVCVMVQTGCEPHGDHAHCDATFMPEPGGEVAFTALGSRPGDSWAGSLSGVRFVEVEIDGELQTTPASGGGSFVMADWSFELVLEEGR